MGVSTCRNGVWPCVFLHSEDIRISLLLSFTFIYLFIYINCLCILRNLQSRLWEKLLYELLSGKRLQVRKNMTQILEVYDRIGTGIIACLFVY